MFVVIVNFKIENTNIEDKFIETSSIYKETKGLIRKNYLVNHELKKIKKYIKNKFGENSLIPKSNIDRPFTPLELKEFCSNKYVTIGNHTLDHTNLNILNLEIKETKSDFRRKHVFKNVDKKNIYKVLKENFFYKDKLRPIVKIEYNRKYFQCIYGRITYDYGLKYTDLRYKNNQIFSNKTVLELKNDNINLKDKFIKKFFFVINKNIIFKIKNTVFIIIIYASKNIDCT